MFFNFLEWLHVRLKSVKDTEGNDNEFADPKQDSQVESSLYMYRYQQFFISNENLTPFW